MLRVLPPHPWFVVDMLKIPKSMSTYSERKLLFTYYSVSQFPGLPNPMKELTALSASLSHPIYSAVSSNKISLPREKYPCLRSCKIADGFWGRKVSFLEVCGPEGHPHSSGRAHTGVYKVSLSWTEYVIGAGRR